MTSGVTTDGHTAGLNAARRSIAAVGSVSRIGALIGSSVVAGVEAFTGEIVTHYLLTDAGAVLTTDAGARLTYA